MFESTFEYFGFLYSKFVFRKEKDTQQSISDFLSNAQNILIFLPVDYEDSQAACNSFLQLKDKIRNAELTILTEGIRAVALSELPRTKIIRISQAHINKFFLPRKNLLERILKTKYDVAIDLNFDFYLYTAYICKKTGARYRIGFSSKFSDYFFNIQFNFNKSQQSTEIYRQLVEYLKKF